MFVFLELSKLEILTGYAVFFSFNDEVSFYGCLNEFQVTTEVKGCSWQ